MLRSSKSLTGYKIHAKDGDMGKISEFFFDDESWTIRYLVVDTGTWLAGRKVLLSPLFAMGKPDWKSKTFPVDLTKEQVKNSPDVALDKPVSRQHEIELSKYYGWRPYWSPGVIAGAHPVIPVTPQTEQEKGDAAEEKGDPHLRSTREVTGYNIHAADGEIGHVEEFIIDDESWIIRYLVVDTRNWLPGRKVVVSPAWVKKVSWGDEMVDIDLSRESIKDSPEYDPSTPINQQYEMRLYDFYGRPKYWL